MPRLIDHVNVLLSLVHRGLVHFRELRELLLLKVLLLQVLFQLTDLGEYVRLRVSELSAIRLIVVVILGVLVFVENVAAIDCT